MEGESIFKNIFFDDDDDDDDKHLFSECNSRNNLQEEWLTRFAIAWPLSQHTTKNSFMTRILEC